MFRKLFISAVSVFAFMASVNAQERLVFSDMNVERNGKKVNVSFSAKAAEDAVKSGSKLLVTPMLSNSQDTVKLDPFVVTGRRMENIERQKAKLAKQEYAKGRTHIENSEQVSYSATLPFEEWMGRNLTMSVHTVEMTCCKTIDRGCKAMESYELAPAFVPAVVTAVVPNVSKVDEDVKKQYPFLRKAGTDAEAERGISVRFPVSKMEIREDFSDNAKSLREIIDAISLVMNDEWTALNAIDIAGYASPEGEHEMNVTLSQGRADALKAYIIKELDLNDGQFNITAGAEDWSGLKSLVEKSDMADRAKVIEIIDSIPSQERQAAFKKLSGGRTYRTLLNTFYPQLRDACYINVWYSEKEDMVARTINEAIEDVNAERYGEAIEKLLPHKEDSRTWNTLGSAYLLMDALEEAETWFEAAAKNGDEEARKNLELMKEINK